MTNYFSLLVYSGAEDINLHSEEEQFLIIDKMHEYFMAGRTTGSRKMVEDFSATSAFDIFCDIFNELEILYTCETYGPIKYIPQEKYSDYQKKFRDILNDYVKDVDRLFREGVSELEYLLSFIETFERNINKESHILFSIS